MGSGEIKKDFKNYLSGKKLKCGPIKRKLLKMMSDYISVHDRNDTQGNEYINRFCLQRSLFYAGHRFGMLH